MLKIIENKGLLVVSRRLNEGYHRPEDVMDAEEVVGQILGDLDSIQSPTKRRRLLKLAKGYMKLFGLDKERDWMAQYNMRKNAKPQGEIA